jgi:hypothetical protein
MPTNFQQSKDIVHPLAFNFIDKCKKLNVLLEPNEINAIDFLTRQLVKNNLWDKFKAIYPFVGKVPTVHSLNLKNTERHYIVWHNSANLKHDKNGVTNTGIGYGNTVIAPSFFSDNDIHISIYCSDYWQNINSSAPAIGTRTPSSFKSNDYENAWMHTITLKSLEPIIINGIWNRAPIFTYSCGPSKSANVRFAGDDSSGFSHVETHGFIVGVNGIRCYVNGELFGRLGLTTDTPSLPINQVSTRTLNGVTAAIPNISQFPFLLFTNDPFSQSSGKARVNLRFASVGYSINDNENKIFYNIVQEFQRILGREVYPVKLKTFEEIFSDELSCNVKFNKLTTLTTKPYREYLSKSPQPKENEKINSLSANLKISKIEVIGPIRIFAEDSANISVSIQSFTEI